MLHAFLPIEKLKLKAPWNLNNEKIWLVLKTYVYYLRSILVNDLSILRNLLFSRHNTVEQLDGVIFFVDIKLPNEEFFRSKEQ